MPFEISLAGEGVYKLKNTLHGSNIGSTSDDGFFTTNNLSDLSLVKAEKANVPLSITAAGWCTLILPFDAEIPEGFEVYSCTGTEVPVGTSTALVLEKAESIEAHTPYIVKGKDGDTYDFSDYGTALQDQYAAGLMTGTFTQQKAVANTYVLQNQEGKVGFYKVAAGSEPTIKPYRAYINADVAEANIVALLFPGHRNRHQRNRGRRRLGERVRPQRHTRTRECEVRSGSRRPFQRYLHRKRYKEAVK